ncbi:MAG: response regulator transcription factor [Solirubrobacterales bacterium]
MFTLHPVPQIAAARTREGLSPRESEVLRLLARGRTTQSIAAELGISPRTVHKHTERIHAKLGTHDRAQAIATALAAEQEVGETQRAPAG